MDKTIMIKAENYSNAICKIVESPAFSTLVEYVDGIDKITDFYIDDEGFLIINGNTFKLNFDELYPTKQIGNQAGGAKIPLRNIVFIVVVIYCGLSLFIDIKTANMRNSYNSEIGALKERITALENNTVSVSSKYENIYNKTINENIEGAKNDNDKKLHGVAAFTKFASKFVRKTKGIATDVAKKIKNHDFKSDLELLTEEMKKDRQKLEDLVMQDYNAIEGGRKKRNTKKRKYKKNKRIRRTNKNLNPKQKKYI
jgi:hypothetical protein